MNPIDCRTAKASLARKGFRPSENDHTFFRFYVGDRKTSFMVKFSQGLRELKPSHIRASARVCQMTAEQLFGVLSCDLDERWVANHLVPLTRFSK